MEPSIKVLYSESNHTKLQPGSVMSLGAANSFFEQRDFMCEEYNTIENVVYEISYMVDDEVRTYCCTQNLGDGEGSVINHLRKSTIDALKTLEESAIPGRYSSSKNPFSILRVSCQNMLQYILPQLEAYCLAYKTLDIIDSFFVDNCPSRLNQDISSVTNLIHDEPDAFIAMLNETILKNPDDISLISAIETVVDKTGRYVELMKHKDGHRDDLVGILQKATERATIINENSAFSNWKPPPLGDFVYFDPELLD